MNDYMEFNLFDFCATLEEIREYIGDSPKILLSNNILYITEIPSSINAEKLKKIVTDGLINSNKVNVYQCNSEYYVLSILN